MWLFWEDFLQQGAAEREVTVGNIRYY